MGLHLILTILDHDILKLLHLLWLFYKRLFLNSSVYFPYDQLLLLIQKIYLYVILIILQHNSRRSISLCDTLLLLQKIGC